MSKKKDVKVTTGIAIKEDLLERIRRAADKEGRSVSSYICRILDKEVK